MAGCLVPATLTGLLACAHHQLCDGDEFESLTAELDSLKAPYDVPALATHVASCLKLLSSQHWPAFALLRRLVETLLQAAAMSVEVVAGVPDTQGQENAGGLLCHTIVASHVCLNALSPSMTVFANREHC